MIDYFLNNIDETQCLLLSSVLLVALYGWLACRFYKDSQADKVEKLNRAIEIKARKEALRGIQELRDKE